MANQPPLALTAAELLELFHRITARAYWRPLKTAADKGLGGGYELYQALAAMWARISTATVRADLDYRLDTAPGGELALVDLTFTRDTAGPALEVGPGTVCETENGKRYVVLRGESLSWVDAETGTKGPLTAASLVESYQANVPEDTITRVALVNPGGQDPAAYAALTCAHAAPSVGGIPEMLGAVVRNRGLNRRTGKDDETLRARAKALADIITPAATRRLLDAILLPLGITGRIVEGIDIGLACDDGACDEPGSDIEIMTAAGPHMRGTFFAVMENPTHLLPGHHGMFCDDGACDWDATDGEAWQSQAFYQALDDSLRTHKAAGIFATAVLED